MGTITAQSIIDKAELILHDSTNVRWTANELLGWLNMGQRVIAKLKPNAYPVRAVMTCAAGTRQTIPAGGVQVLDVIRNMGTGGATPGLPVTFVERAVLDHHLRNWHGATAKAEATTWAHDNREPKIFYVYPPQPASSQGQLEVIYGGIPADVAIGAAITLDDVYEAPLMDYVLYRAFDKDGSVPANAVRARSYYESMLRELGADVQNDEATKPSTNAPPQERSMATGGIR